MKKFPGRFLEEIDGIDWGRFNRAVRAENIKAWEDIRAMRLRVGKDFEPEEMEVFIEHDRLAAEYGK